MALPALRHRQSWAENVEGILTPWLPVQLQSSHCVEVTSVATRVPFPLLQHVFIVLTDKYTSFLLNFLPVLDNENHADVVGTTADEDVRGPYAVG